MRRRINDDTYSNYFINDSLEKRNLGAIKMRYNIVFAYNIKHPLMEEKEEQGNQPDNPVQPDDIREDRESIP